MSSRRHSLLSGARLAEGRQLLQWSLLILAPAILAGSASAFFLWSLEWVTWFRWEHPAVLFGLPLAGLVVGLVYHWLGRPAEGGNNLIIDEIHTPGGGVPARLAPLVLFGTLATHLAGGSAGREGTAVQMGGAIAGWCGRRGKLSPQHLRILLMAGVAAGFGSVFGTPLTGALFAMEVLTIGRMEYEALIPVLLASVVGDLTCTAWGAHHTAYHIDFGDGGRRVELWLLLKVAGAGLIFGLVGLLFSEVVHLVPAWFKRAIPWAPARPVVGGFLVIAGVYALGTRDYLGIGVTNPDSGVVTILSAFTPGGAHAFSWWWKLVFTCLTLGSGFKGGEVTPLFFIGATLGNVLAGPAHAPVDLFAGVGFIAVFAAATNTPLACTVMGLELFGAANTVYFATACFVAYFASGNSGIYLSQRLGVSKHFAPEHPPGLPLREVRQRERGSPKR